MPPDARDTVHATSVRARLVSTAHAAIVTTPFWLRLPDAELVVRVPDGGIGAALAVGPSIAMCGRDG
jgi:hypothetical protein